MTTRRSRDNNAALLYEFDWQLRYARTYCEVNGGEWCTRLNTVLLQMRHTTTLPLRGLRRLEHARIKKSNAKRPQKH